MSDLMEPMLVLQAVEHYLEQHDDRDAKILLEAVRSLLADVEARVYCRNTTKMTQCRNKRRKHDDQ